MKVRELISLLKGYDPELEVRIANVAIEDDESMPTFEIKSVESAKEAAGEEFEEDVDMDFVFIEMFDEAYVDEDYLTE